MNQRTIIFAVISTIIISFFLIFINIPSKSDIGNHDIDAGKEIIALRPDFAKLDELRHKLELCKNNEERKLIQAQIDKESVLLLRKIQKIIHIKPFDNISANNFEH